MIAQQPVSAPSVAPVPPSAPGSEQQIPAVVVPWSYPAATLPTGPITSISQLQAQLHAVVQQLDLRPSICKRSAEEAFMQQAVRGVLDWSAIKKAKAHGSRSYLLGLSRDRGGSPSDGFGSRKTKFAKAGGSSGRTYTSRFRGVHQTFPTRRWEAQFRRNGKPTSLGCFDKEDEAARAYDKMMLWCEIHAAGGVKGTVTNFDLAEYEKDIAWLNGITQDDLIESLRCEGRRQATHRTGVQQQPKKSKATGTGTDADDSDSGAALAAALAAAAEATAAVAGGGNDVGLSRLGLMHNIAGNLAADPAAAAAAAVDPVAAAVVEGSPDAAPQAALPAAAAAAGGGENSIAVNAALMGISQEAMAAIQQLQQQLDQAAATGEAADPEAAAAAAFEIGQIAGSNLVAAVADPAAAAAAAGTAIAQAAAAAAQNVTPKGAARLLAPSAAGSSNCLTAVAGVKPEDESGAAVGAVEAAVAALHDAVGIEQLAAVPILSLPPFGNVKQQQQ